MVFARQTSHSCKLLLTLVHKGAQVGRESAKGKQMLFVPVVEAHTEEKVATVLLTTL